MKLAPHVTDSAMRHCAAAHLIEHNLVELIARIEALLVAAATRETTLRAGPLELDLIERTAKRGDRFIDLLPREFRLLEYMMRRKGHVLTREMLFREVWNYKFVPKTNLVDVHIGRLRRKIDGPHGPPMIHTVRGRGFIFVIEDGRSLLEHTPADIHELRDASVNNDRSQCRRACLSVSRLTRSHDESVVQ